MADSTDHAKPFLDPSSPLATSCNSETKTEKHTPASVVLRTEVSDTLRGTR